MKTKQFWIVTSLTLLSCLPISVRADSVEGKAIICDEGSENEDSRYTGWEFIEDTKVTYRYLITKTSRAKFRLPSSASSAPLIRREYVDRIAWEVSYNEYVLDRKTLELAVTGPASGDRIESCEVYGSREEYLEAFEMIRQQEQERLDKKMEGNKI